MAEDDAVSVPDFKHHISICRKETKEARYRLRMIAKAGPSKKEAARLLWKETTELNLILGAWRRAGKPETRNPESENRKPN